MEYSADLKAFNQLFADYQGRFIRFANIYVRDIAVAEDFTIEALMQYWENRNTLEGRFQCSGLYTHDHQKQMYQLPATYTSQGRCQRTSEESCRMGTEYPHLHPRSLQPGRTVYSRGTGDRKQNTGHPP